MQQVSVKTDTIPSWEDPEAIAKVAELAKWLNED